MNHKVLTIGKGVILMTLLLLGGSAVYALYVLKRLPWQKPAFDHEFVGPCNASGGKAVLLFSKTNGFRHKSIEKGIEAIKAEGQKLGWQVDATEDGGYFNPTCLRSYKAVIFLSTTGDILTDTQQKAFQNYIENGGGYAGIHSASDMEYDWDWYGQLLGTRFRDHTFLPNPAPVATIVTEPVQHPATAGLPARWSKKDEWYNFKDNVRDMPGFTVLLTVDEQTYSAFWPKAMQGDHPIAWTRTVGKGRMFYTAIGHTASTFEDKNALMHIMGGIGWAACF
ncbi:ThuA domain-containing protein [Dyadobacter sp. MSC1_007]|jgi:type 1 glutamine amidotransferase|uniref:ThuA domain-containing protein n=1 Tax=Dyadobacter sp. MSC1_007 TaxID=2909264 RepID=UPI00202DDA45|nr:ThuA domain-containing protein [Dyadobacter sp. MSC1_007]